MPLVKVAGTTSQQLNKVIFENDGDNGDVNRLSTDLWQGLEDFKMKFHVLLSSALEPCEASRLFCT